MRALERRISRLERGTHIGADLDRERAIVAAYELVNHNPELASAADHILAGATSSGDWQRALVAVIAAEGGLEAVVRHSSEADISRP